ncbi:hypothetical protein P7K49_005542, partial [Saguinus oedipus]
FHPHCSAYGSSPHPINVQILEVPLKECVPVNMYCLPRKSTREKNEERTQFPCQMDFLGHIASSQKSMLWHML